MATAPFPVDPVLTGIALAYKNEEYIADQVMPRVEPILAKEELTYTRMTLAEGYSIPNTLVGRKSNPTEVEFSGARLTGRTQDYGLDDLIPSGDVANASGALDPRGFAVQSLADLIAQDREQRVANIVFANATYPAANRVTLSGTSQWSDRVNSDPLNAILTALDVPVLRPNIGVLGQATWTQLRQHPRIVTAIFGQTANAGAVSRQQVAELLELDEIIVGKS
ncbi:MAG: capsid protein, partial [Azospirillum sp.]|nr:capsid protein [Azospirillum sp.]